MLAQELLQLANYTILDVYSKQIRFRCPVGHIDQNSFHRIKQGSRCRICHRLSLSQPDHLTPLLEQAGLKILSEQSNSVHYYCVRGHINRRSKSHRFIPCCLSCEHEDSIYSIIEEECLQQGIELLTPSFQKTLIYKVPLGAPIEINFRTLMIRLGLIKRCKSEISLVKKSILAAYKRTYRQLKQASIAVEEDFDMAHLFFSMKPNYEEWLRGGDWHIDHIMPIKAFIDNGLLDPNLINSVFNLQIIYGKRNLSKGATYSQAEFESWVAYLRSQSHLLECLRND